ncbi:MaoC family dehydratase [Baekduia sp. Peel2402]|uniref:MaoC family dehydratase n=1 Tax=Baekduia sp. Peel2402 TaxID=3458296 RepID=UPI00403E9814
MSVDVARPASVADLQALAGTELGPTEWLEVGQDKIDAFAEVTGDHQWIHVDPERAAESPLGTTIAHGLLTLSLGPAFMEALMSFEGFAHALNYGYEKVRFPAPVPVGSRLRMRAVVADVSEVPGGAQVTMTQTIEREGGDKPVLVAQAVARFYER